MIDKTYEPGAVEARIYEAWLKANAFAAGAGAKPGASRSRSSSRRPT